MYSKQWADASIGWVSQNPEITKCDTRQFKRDKGL